MDPNPHPAAATTAAAHAAALDELPFSDTQDFTDAGRGFITGLPDLIVRGLHDRVVWDMASYDFLEPETAPDTVHPSLWRQARLNRNHGLFAVTDGCYQVRGYDLSNMTIVEGETGVIVIDPLISTECAAAAFDLYCTHRGRRPIRALLYTHSHVDHFGGAAGVIDADDATSGRIPVIAPDGFLEHAVAENVMVGNAMQRRAQYMYGALLARGPRGQVDAGLGKTVSLGTVSLIPPTQSVTHTGQTITIDGIEMVFQLTPGSEAPAEMNFHFPKRAMLCAAENTSHNMHNIITLRGALVRDALVWSEYLEETIELFGDRTDVLFAQHHWPTWGRDEVGEFLGLQRDLYRYLHDQTVRLLNQGLSGTEIAETFVLPPVLANTWHCRGYYGSVSHNVKAIAQRYLGWFDGNPARLAPLPPEQSAPGYVELMGGAEAVVAAARAAADNGEYRWAAQLLDHVVFADATRADARLLLADVLEQLGYQSENATWRNFYLMGTHELRHGVAEMGPLRTTVAAALTLEQVFDVLAVRINGAEASTRRLVMSWTLPDIDDHYTVVIDHGALHTVAGRVDPTADVGITIDRHVLDGVITGRTPLADALAQGHVTIDGDADALAWFFGLLETSTPDFPIVTP